MPGSSSSSTRPSSSRAAAPQKVLPFTTQQIAELDLLMGNTKAAKGKVASQFAPGAQSSSSGDKRYIAPYVPLNGSAPSGTRSFGRDGEFHPMDPPSGTTKREVGVKGESVPYMRDENGVMWSGQEEMDEFQQLLDQAEARRRRKAGIGHIDTGRRSSEDSWKQFPASASSVDSSSSSVLRSAGSASDVFDLGYDEAVMIPEGGAVRMGAVSTVGGLTKVAGGVSLAPSTRGVESFPAPQITTTKSASNTPRPKGADRRIRPGTAPQPAYDPVDGRAGASQTSLGTIRPVLPLDQEGKLEFFGDAFAPPPAPAQRSALPPLQPIQNNATWGQQQSSPALTPKSKLHRHSTSLAVGSANFFQNLVNAHAQGDQSPASPLTPLTPTSPSYLAPLPHPDKYSGLRQASFSGPGGFAAKGSLRSPTFTPPPVPSLPAKYATQNMKAIKKKSSGLNVAQMFKKLTKV